jgi:hypothetical protein
MRKIVVSLALVVMLGLLATNILADTSGSSQANLTIEKYLRITVLTDPVSVTVETGESGNNANVPVNFEVAANVNYDIEGQITGDSTVQVGCDEGDTISDDPCTKIYADDLAWGISASGFNGEVWRTSQAWPSGIYGQVDGKVDLLIDQTANEPGEETKTIYTGVCTWTFEPDPPENHLGYFWGGTYTGAATIDLYVTEH